MWLLDGLLLYCVPALLSQAGSLMTGSLLELSLRNPRLYVRVSKQLLKSSSMQIARSQANKNGTKAINAKPKKRFALRILAVALLLPTLAGCFSFRSKKPIEPLVKPKVFQCLDKAMQECEGVTQRQSISDAGTISAIASEALSKLTACRDKHHEILVCVMDFVGSPKKAK